MYRTPLGRILFFSLCLADGLYPAICALFYASECGEITEEDKKWALEVIK
jgi:hypothetical protein